MMWCAGEGRRARGKKLKPRAINHALDFREIFFFFCKESQLSSEPAVEMSLKPVKTETHKSASVP